MTLWPFVLFAFSLLEAEFQRKLNLPSRDVERIWPKAAAVARSELAAPKLVLLKMLNDSVRNSTFEASLIRQAEVLLQSEIELVEGIATRDVPAGVAEGLVDAGDEDIVAIEVIVNRPVTSPARVRVPIRLTERDAAEERRQVRCHRRRAVAQIDRLPAGHRVDAGHRPPANECVKHLRDAAPEILRAPKGSSQTKLVVLLNGWS